MILVGLSMNDVWIGVFRNWIVDDRVVSGLSEVDLVK